ncbi:ABC transporter ATP-binding protein [Sporichthya polymorpha]|uniref:ABC transporter ATP-binding protein n=1 Tax=Sporichthya polymorpha TaxID=35751 RepID=UPI0003769589|nr:ABC transporter ATP-binding protein [Sporichthya polymorpha]
MTTPSATRRPPAARRLLRGRADTALRRRIDAGVRPAPAVTEARTPRPLGDPLLRVEDVTVRFGGVTANDSVSLVVPRGCVTALIGPNGAGKTTMFNVVSGAITPAAGTILFEDRDITRSSVSDRARRGLARTFQNLELVDTATVLDNVLLGTTQYVRWGFLRAMAPVPGVFQADERLREVAVRAIGLCDLGPYTRELAGNLPYGKRRHVELARALAAGPRLLLLDEPSAGMDAEETAELGHLIVRIVDRLGVSVLVVEHDMSFVRPFADYVHVLNQGRLLRSGLPADVLVDPEVRRIYLGTLGAGHA